MASQSHNQLWRENRATSGWSKDPGPATWQPRADICETNDGLHIEVEVPGLREEDLSLHFEAGYLVIEGQRARPDHGAPRRCWQVEIQYGPLRRVLPLPKDIDGTRIEARLSNGILAIRAPRITPAAPEKTRIVVR